MPPKGCPRGLGGCSGAEWDELTLGTPPPRQLRPPRRTRRWCCPRSSARSGERAGEWINKKKGDLLRLCLQARRIQPLPKPAPGSHQRIFRGGGRRTPRTTHPPSFLGGTGVTSNSPPRGPDPPARQRQVWLSPGRCPCPPPGLLAGHGERTDERRRFNASVPGIQLGSSSLCWTGKLQLSAPRSSCD